LGGLDIVMAGPKHVYDVFGGRIPSSLESNWLEHDHELKSIVIKSYRYATKMTIDQAILGEMESLSEWKARHWELQLELNIFRIAWRNWIPNGM
jgi:hypothetical protein